MSSFGTHGGSATVDSHSALLNIDFLCFAAQMNWSSWSRYSACSVSCGQGRQRRQRQCIKTSPTDTGTCRGPKEMYAPCQMLACPSKCQYPLLFGFHIRCPRRSNKIWLGLLGPAPAMKNWFRSVANRF